MSTLEISGTYNQQKKYQATINAVEAAKLAKVIEVKTPYKQSNGGTDEAVYLFFILIKDGTELAAGHNQSWENGTLHVSGNIEHNYNNDIGAVVIYDTDENLIHYDGSFKLFLKDYIKQNMGNPHGINPMSSSYVNKTHFTDAVKETIRTFKAALVSVSPFSGDKHQPLRVPPTRVGNGGVLKPGG